MVLRTVTEDAVLLGGLGGERGERETGLVSACGVSGGERRGAGTRANTTSSPAARPRGSLHHVGAAGHDLLAGLAAPDADGDALHGELRWRDLKGEGESQRSVECCSAKALSRPVCQRRVASPLLALPTPPRPAPARTPTSTSRGARSPTPTGLPPPARTLPQKLQKYLECWLTSIFLICLRRDAPYRVPYLPTMPTCARGWEGGCGRMARGEGVWVVAGRVCRQLLAIWPSGRGARLVAPAAKRRCRPCAELPLVCPACCCAAASAFAPLCFRHPLHQNSRPPPPPTFFVRLACWSGQRGAQEQMGRQRVCAWSVAS
jgi:hypothetical protein